MVNERYQYLENDDIRDALLYSNRTLTPRAIAARTIGGLPFLRCKKCGAKHDPRMACPARERVRRHGRVTTPAGKPGYVLLLIVVQTPWQFASVVRRLMMAGIAEGQTQFELTRNTFTLSINDPELISTMERIVRGAGLARYL